MNITANLEIDKREIENFQELERTVYRTVLKLGCEIIDKALEAMDEQLLGNRDVKRFRRQSGDGSLIDKKDSTWYIAREVMTNAKESADTCGEWNLSCHAPGNKLSANL